MPFRNGRQRMDSGSPPVSTNLYLSPHPDPMFRDPLKICGTLLPVKETTEYLGQWWNSHLSFKEHISVLNIQRKEAQQSSASGFCTWCWEGTVPRCSTDLLFAPSWTMVALGIAQRGIPTRDKWTASTTMDLKLALWALCTSPISRLYTEANEIPSEEVD